MTDPLDQQSPPPGSSAGEPTGVSDRPIPASAPDAPVTAPSAPYSGDPATTGRPAPGFNEKGKVRATRVSGVWVGLIGTALFLILLVIFIAQNSRKVALHFFGWHGQFSLALTILLSAVIGVLLVSIPGTVRIFQLRRALRKNGPGRP